MVTMCEDSRSLMWEGAIGPELRLSGTLPHIWLLPSGQAREGVTSPKLRPGGTLPHVAAAISG